MLTLTRWQRELLPAALAGVSVTLLLPVTFSQATQDEVMLSVLDVGQGSAALLEATDGSTLLVDAGPGTSALAPLAKELPFMSRDISVLLVTHYDADHAGGVIEILRRYNVGEVLVGYFPQEDDTLGRLVVEEAQLQGVPVRELSPGDTFSFSDGTVVEALWPTEVGRMQSSNDASSIVRISRGEIQVMITGDAGVGVEQELVSTYSGALESEVLVLGHHGSSTSTSELFLSAVSPEVAVVSAGKDNSYGHPHTEVMERLENFKIPLLGTAEEGTIRYVLTPTAVLRDR